MNFSLSKIIAASLLSGLFIYSDIDPFTKGKFLHMINFPIHEVGHIIFSFGGKFLTIAGGSLFQILLPCFCVGYFFYEGKPFSAAICLMWVGNNFFDVAVYANDAVFTELPLSNLFGGTSETIIHDWNYMLSETHLLHKTNLIAAIIRAIGGIITFAAITGVFYFARKEESLN